MNIPCKILTTAALTFAAMLPISAQAQSSYYGLSPFEGIYAGGYVGGVMDPSAAWTLGGVAGANFAITDGFVAGVEAQAGITLDTSTSIDALMLGHLGYEANDQVMVYGAMGAGIINGVGSYAVGGGAEMIATDQLGIRGELLGTGAWGGGPKAARATAGVIWHVQ